MKPATKTALIGGIFSVVASVFGAVFTGIIPVVPEKPQGQQPTTIEAKISPIEANQPAGRNIVFSGIDSTGQAGSKIVRYSWDFGDGSTDTGSSAFHRYEKGGPYRVTLTITDDEGRTDQDAAILEIANSTQRPSNGSSPETDIDPANLISISAISPRQLTYFVNDTVYLDFTITDEQNIPYNFTANFILDDMVEISTNNTYEFTHSPVIWADVYAPGIWQVQVVVEWEHEGKIYSKERQVSFRVEEPQ